jgi:hypothetical protein
MSLLMQDVLVPKVGLEPTRDFTSADFESAASANSATSAYRYASVIFLGPTE